MSIFSLELLHLIKKCIGLESLLQSADCTYTCIKYAGFSGKYLFFFLQLSLIQKAFIFVDGIRLGFNFFGTFNE